MYQNNVKRQRPITFRHFSKKSYALFNCLGKEVRIGVLSAATLLSASAVASNSFNISFPIHKDTLDLEEAEVIGTCSPLKQEHQARIVTIIDHNDIVETAAHSINDLLKLAIGVDVRQRGNFNIQSDISINGGTFDQITLLLNGIPINNPQTGHIASDFPINIQNIERIEILEGASSRVIGSQAFSGAINIVTRKEVNSIHVNLESGSYGTIGGNTSLAIKSKKTIHNFSGSYARSDGAIKNSDFNSRKGFYQGFFRDENIKLNWQTGFSSKDYGANTFYTAAYPNQWEENQRYFIMANGKTKIGSFHFNPSLSYIRSYDHFQLFRNEHTAENFHRTDVFTTKLNFWKAWILGRTSFSSEIRHEGILSTNLGKPIDPSIELTKVPFEDNIYYNKKDQRTNLSYYLEHNILLEKFTISMGVMANRNSSIDESFHFYPGIDVRFRPVRTLSVFASWNKALRLPTFTDLYYKSPTQEGNINLKPETTSTYKIGLQHHSKSFSATINAYYNKGNHMIDWVMYNNSDKFHATNFKLDNYGFTFEGRIRGKELFGQAFPIRNLSAAYSYGYQKRHDKIEVYKSNYALEYLRHKIVIKLSHDIWRDLSASWSLRWKDRMGDYISYKDNKPTGIKENYTPYALVDGKINWKMRKYDFYVTFNNLFNHRYYDLGSVQQPGFTFMVGTNWKFNL